MIKGRLNSPCCIGAVLELTITKRKHIVKNKVYEGDFYVYICDKCKDKYTSTESDEYSLANLKQKTL